MSLEYAEGRIREALKLSGGNAARARKQIIDWSREDMRLLQELTRGHLSGIVAYNVERVLSGRAEAAKKKKETPPKATPSAPPKTGKDSFGLEILKAVASSSSEIFGFEDPGLPHKRGQASKQHIAAMKAIASKKKD
ncbi:MAG: hypothetical protein R3D66_05120 [Alphaproteobacteria bacterium]|nr:hypothetical protein [Alphaproteobacteria bacterium]